MKVLYIIRRNYKKYWGGDSHQLTRNIEYLYKLGVEPEIIEAGDSIAGRKYDLVHFYNLGRPGDLLPYLSKISSPLVVSSIYVDFREHDVRERSFPSKDLFSLAGVHGAEWLKTMARAVKGQGAFPGIRYLFQGHKNAVNLLLEHSDSLITATGHEAERILKTFGKLPFNVDVVPLGIDPIFFERNKPWDERSGVISAGRLESLKNQVGLIKALYDTDEIITLAGKYGANSLKYKAKLKLASQGRKNIYFTGHLIKKAYRDALLSHRVHAQPSWFETTGLASLEAAASGCNVVITNRGDTAEVFRDFAFYVDPANTRDIQNKVLMALSQPPLPEQRDYFYENFSWEYAALKIFEVYKKLI